MDSRPLTDPSRTGLSTSEGRLAFIAFVVGTVLEVVVVPVLQQVHQAMPHAAWVSPAMMGAGALLQLASVFGYIRSRTAIKVAILAQDAPAPVVNMQSGGAPGQGPIRQDLVSALEQMLEQARTPQGQAPGGPTNG